MWIDQRHQGQEAVVEIPSDPTLPLLSRTFLPANDGVEVSVALIDRGRFWRPCTAGSYVIALRTILAADVLPTQCNASTITSVALS